MIMYPVRILLNTFHFFRSAGEQFCAVPRYFCFGTFCPKVKARSVSTGPQPTGFGEVPQQAFWKAFLPPPGAKILSVFTLELLAKNASVATLALLAVSEILCRPVFRFLLVFSLN